MRMPLGLGPSQPFHKPQPNRFRIRCCLCDYWVQPNEGIVFRSCVDAPYWTGMHQECPEDDGDNYDPELRWDRTWG